MGVDMLDFSFRIEKSFGIKIVKTDYDRLPKRFAPGITAGDLHDWVVSLCKDRGMAVPWSSWTRVRIELAKTVGKPPQIIHRGTYIVGELGFS